MERYGDRYPIALRMGALRFLYKKTLKPRDLDFDALPLLKAGPVRETTLVFATACQRTKKFVAEIAVTVFDVDEGEPGPLGANRRVDEIPDDLFNFRIRQTGIVEADAHFRVE